MSLSIGRTKIALVRADITAQSVDAIVNAANSALAGGGGVDGAIHRAAGPSVMEECRLIRGGCPAGSAVATGAGKLSARTIIHAVGPVWYGGGKGEAELLASAYRASLQVAMRESCRTIAFPSLSTGAYGFPIGEATRIALNTVGEVLTEHPKAFDEVRFVVFSDRDLRVYQDALGHI